MQEGVTTAIVGFLLLCIAFPNIVRSKTHYYAAFFVVLAIILLGALAVMIGERFEGAASFLTALLQIVALVSLLLAAGGLTPRQLLGEMKEAAEEIRHGESRDVIVPITGQMPKPKRPVVYRDSVQPAGDQGHVAYKIDETTAARGDEDNSQIPLE
jgi:hypothetical protein